MNTQGKSTLYNETTLDLSYFRGISKDIRDVLVVRYRLRQETFIAAVAAMPDVASIPVEQMEKLRGLYLDAENALYTLQQYEDRCSTPQYTMAKD